MPSILERSLTMAAVWFVAALLLFWPRLPAAWRRLLALLTSGSGIVFLILAVRSEGLRETPTLSVFLMGDPYVTHRASALASLPYYSASGVCLLLGTTALALSDRLVERLSRRWLVFAIGVSLAVTLYRFVLEKIAAPWSWTQVVGITWIAPVVGAFFAASVRRDGRGTKALLGALLAYAFSVRAAVAGLMVLASTLRLGSHYDISALVRVTNPITRQVYEFAPGSLTQVMSLGVIPQLGVWPVYTVVSGLIGAAAAYVLLAQWPGARARALRSPEADLA
jgi:hypothetical protein